MSDNDDRPASGERRNVKPPRILPTGRGSFGNGPRGLPPSGKWILGIIAAVVVLALLIGGLTAQVDAAEACAVVRFGDVVAEAGPGLHLKVPFADKYRCYRTAATFYEVLEDEFGSNADYTDTVLDGVTRDGQPLGLTFSVRYHVPRENVETVYSTIGRTMDQVNERVVKFHTRTIARQLVQKYTAAELYSGDLSSVSQAISAALIPRFEESGVALEYFEIKRPRFQPEYEAAIEAKQIAREEIETKANQAEAAQQDALRAANLAQGDANAERIRAQGEAEAIELRGLAIRNNPEVISLNYIEALKTINWAIFDGSNVSSLFTLPSVTGGTTTPGVTPTPEPTATAAPES
jgi:regulator of protease activity HflC (stomatin/prohibitin superfamily)